MKVKKSLKIRMAVLGSFVLLFGTNTAQAIDWNSISATASAWAAQIATNIATHKELLHQSAKWAGAAAVGAATIYLADKWANTKTDQQIKLEAFIVNAEKQEKEVLSFYQSFYQLVKALIDDINDVNPKDSNDLGVSYAWFKTYILDYRERFNKEAFENSSLLTGSLHFLINYIGKAGLLLPGVKVSDDQLQELLCMASNIIQVMQDRLADLNVEVNLARIELKEQGNASWVSSKKLARFRTNKDGCVRFKWSLYKSSISDYRFLPYMNDYFEPNGKLNAKFLELFDIKNYTISGLGNWE